MTVKLKKLKDYYGDNDYETTRMGFVSNDTFVTEPIMSECGRFEVNPIGVLWNNGNTNVRNRQI